jgi:hypothetical protein
MKRLALYGAVAILSFATFVVLFAPASAIWLLMRDTVSQRLPDLAVGAVSGTLWSGQADLQYRGFPPAALTFQLAFLPLLVGSAEWSTQLEGPGIQASLAFIVTADDLDISGEATIDSRYINAVSSQYGFTFPGKLDIRELQLRSQNHWLQSAAANLRWDGGRVRIAPAGAAPQIADLPALSGRLYQSAEALQLDILQRTDMLMRISLQPTGWAVVDIKARLFTLAGIPAPPGADPDSSAAVFEERIL